MRQDKAVLTIGAPVAQSVIHPQAIAQMPSLGIAANQQGQGILRQGLQGPIAPGLGAERRRREVMTGGIIPGKAKGHRQDSTEILIIKLRVAQAHPLTQPLARTVIEWATGAVDPKPGRLAGDQYFCLWRRPDHRPRPMP